MEVMDSSLDKFYKFIYNVLESSIPEEILGKITVAVSTYYKFTKPVAVSSHDLNGRTPLPFLCNLCLYNPALCIFFLHFEGMGKLFKSK